MSTHSGPSQASIIRLLCTAEQALAAYDGAYDTRDPNHNPTSHLLQQLLEPVDIPATWNGPIAVIQTAEGTPFIWDLPTEGSRGLTGGKCEYQHGARSHRTGRKPVPRAIFKKQLTARSQVSVITHVQ